jgi:hypothetical protein
MARQVQPQPRARTLGAPLVSSADLDLEQFAEPNSQGLRRDPLAVERNDEPPLRHALGW